MIIPFTLGGFGDHVIITTFGAFLIDWWIPAGKIAIRVAGTAVEHPSPAGATLGNAAFAVVFGTGHQD